MARVKSEDRREAIVKVAAETFLETGYDRTSMSMIAERLGGSKATLYNYFKSKEELFLAVLNFEIDTNADAILGTALGQPDTRDALTIVGFGYLMQRLSVRPTRYFRMVSGQSGDSDIGKHFWNKILKPAWTLMCNKFTEFMEEGRLRKADPWVATMHFKGLMESDLVERRLLGDFRDPDPEIVRQTAARGADAFLAIYGPEKGVATTESEG